MSRKREWGGGALFHDVVLHLFNLEVPEDAVGHDGEQRAASQRPAHRHRDHLIPVDAVLAVLGWKRKDWLILRNVHDSQRVEVVARRVKS